jgi:TPP-dependent trihydroxycyclohexane-1,2-dione (THcHDO) dehydratase
MTDEEILKSSCSADTATAAAVERVLARLAAAEKVSEMIKVSLSPKLRKAAEKKTYWWDVGMAVKEWEAARDERP